MLERDIANHDVVAVVARPEDILYDTFTGREILVDYNRNVAVICEESADTIVVVTVLCSKNLKDLVKRRINSGRWVTSSPCLCMGLPSEPRRLDGGSVAGVPAFARGFARIGFICWLGRVTSPFGLPRYFLLDYYPISLDSSFPPFRATSTQGTIQHIDRNPTFKLTATHPPPLRTRPSYEVQINGEKNY